MSGKYKKMPRERWIDLASNTALPINDEAAIKVLAKIDKIDQATPFQSVEPYWWLDMMDLQRELRKQLK